MMGDIPYNYNFFGLIFPFNHRKIHIFWKIKFYTNVSRALLIGLMIKKKSSTIK